MHTNVVLHTIQEAAELSWCKVVIKMSLSLSFLLILLLLNGRVQSNTCSTEGFMELSLLETKTGTSNNGQTTGLAFGSERTRWIITEGKGSVAVY